MKQISIEAKQARKEGYPAFMSSEHIALVLKRDAEKKNNKKAESKSHE